MSELLSASVDRLEYAAVMKINALQAGLLLAPDISRKQCIDFAKPSHQLDSSPGAYLIANPKWLKCPYCDYSLQLKDLDQDIILWAEAPLELEAPDEQSLQKIQFMIEQYNRLSEIDESFVMAHVMSASLEKYLTKVRSIHAEPPWKGPNINLMPLGFLLDIYNNSASAETKQLIHQFLQYQRAASPRQHWLESLILDEDGRMTLDEALYKIAVMKGKAETYYHAAKEHHQRLLSSLDSVSIFQEKSTLALLEDTPNKGRRLFPPRLTSIDDEAIQVESINQLMRIKQLPDI